MYESLNQYIEKNKKAFSIVDTGPDLMLDLQHLPKLIVHEDLLHALNQYLGKNLATMEVFVEKSVDYEGEAEFYDDMYLIDLPYHKDEKQIGYIIEREVFISTEICNQVLSKFKDFAILSDYCSTAV